MLLREIVNLKENDRDKGQLIDSPTKIKDSYGNEFEVTNIEFIKKSYIPDLYIRFSDYDYDEYMITKNGEDWNYTIGDEEMKIIDEDGLEDDSTFISNIMHVLKDLGYDGKSFGRAERGMQGKNFIVLEPGNEFTSWLSENHGWKDEAKNPNNPSKIKSAIHKLIADNMNLENPTAKEFSDKVIDILDNMQHLKELDDISDKNNYAVMTFVDDLNNRFEIQFNMDGDNDYFVQLKSSPVDKTGI